MRIITYPNGDRITQHGDGTRVVSRPDGSWVVEAPGVQPVECRNGCTRVAAAPGTTLRWQHDTRAISASLPGGRSVVATCNAAVLMPGGGGEALEAALEVLPNAREQAEIDRIARLEKRKAEREVWRGRQVDCVGQRHFCVRRAMVLSSCLACSQELMAQRRQAYAEAMAKFEEQMAALAGGKKGKKGGKKGKDVPAPPTPQPPPAPEEPPEEPDQDEGLSLSAASMEGVHGSYVFDLEVGTPPAPSPTPWTAPCPSFLLIPVPTVAR